MMKKNMAPTPATTTLKKPVIQVTPSTDDDDEDHRGGINNNNGHSSAVNAFSHRLNANCCQWLQIVLMSVTLAPVRLLAFINSE